MDERQKLIEEYKNLDWGCTAFVDWVLQDRKRVVAPLVKISKIKLGNMKNNTIDIAVAIERTLTNAGVAQ